MCSFIGRHWPCCYQYMGKEPALGCLLTKLSLPCPCWYIKLWRVIASRNRGV
ncbi:hypothetical protein J3E69DRAFT_320673 [Trichoderma sp. SZMC 28015]